MEYAVVATHMLMPEIGEIKNGNKDMNFLKEIAENGMMDHECNEELKTTNTTITISMRGKYV